MEHSFWEALGIVKALTPEYPPLISKIINYGNRVKSIKPVTHEQVFIDKFWLGKFYLLVCKE